MKQKTKASLQLPRFRADQWAIVQHPARTKVLAMGRRYGKTTMLGILALTAANAGLQPGWLAPTYKRANSFWKFAKQHTGRLQKAGLVRMNKTDMVIEFKQTGGMVSIYTDENADGLRGESFSGVFCVDEAAYIRANTYDEILLPCLADYDPVLYLISSPAGYNWFQELWQQGKSNMQDIASWQCPSLDNPHPRIQAAYWAAKEKIAEIKWRQEWNAEFIASGTGVLQKVRESATATRQTEAIQGHHYSVGADFGAGVGGDYTVLAVYDHDEKAIVYYDRFNTLGQSATIERMKALDAKFKPQVFFCERNSIGIPMTEAAKRAGLKIKTFDTTLVSKASLIEGLALAFDYGNVRIIPDETMIHELMIYELKGTSTSGVNRYGAPSGMHDDIVIASALAVESAVNRRHVARLVGYNNRYGQKSPNYVTRRTGVMTKNGMITYEE